MATLAVAVDQAGQRPTKMVVTHSLTKVLVVVELVESPREETQGGHLMAVSG